jgi:broad specificity phosphatase PhoE
MATLITYFVHSITEDNEKGLATGWLPGKLSAEGVKRAQDMREYLKNANFEAVFCSDLARAMHSTELFFENKFPVFVDWRLRECNYGTLDGRPAAEFKKNREQEYITQAYSGGESYTDVEMRVKSFIDDITILFSGATIAIVAHQAPQLALDVLLIGKTWQQAIAEDWRKTKAYQPGWHYSIP